MYEFLKYVAIFQIFTDIYDLLIGSALVYGALKWRKGLLTQAALYWGIVLGLMFGMIAFLSVGVDLEFIIVTVVLGAIVFPILTYTVPAVNRFVLGFLVTMKLLYMVTTYLCKRDQL